MQTVMLKAKTLQGISTRTTNQKEMDPKTAKIGKLWQTFDNTVPVDYPGGERVYGVYYDYESDAEGSFSVLAGIEGQADSEQARLETITLPAGKYLRFEAVAESPDEQTRIATVIKTWSDIWDYFSNKPAYQRAYETDFEFYKSPTDIEIYISITE